MNAVYVYVENGWVPTLQHAISWIFQWAHPWHFLAAFAAYLFVTMYLYAPFKIRRQQTKEVHIQYWPVELPQMRPEVSQAFARSAEWLAWCGFEAVGHVARDLVKTGQSSFCSLWVHHKQMDSAQIIGVLTPSAISGISVVTLVTFRTEFTDGTSIVTTNSSSAGIFPRDPQVNAIRCPGVQDLGLLYRVHRARVLRDQGSRSTTFVQMEDAESRMVYEHEHTFNRLNDAGYYVMDSQGEHYVPTFRGAFIMTYRLLPPFKQIQRIRKNRLTNRTLKELGFGNMAEFRQMQFAEGKRGGR